MPGINDVRHLGDYIREQRSSSQISLRQLAKLAGVSNPYLSQIERGLRKPSAEILQQIAKGLRISAEAMYVQAGILEHREGSPVVDAVLSDESLTERQKQVLLEIHDSFRKENAASAAAATAAATLAAESTSLAPETLAAVAERTPAAPGNPAATRTATAGRTKATRTPRPTVNTPRTSSTSKTSSTSETSPTPQTAP